MSIIRIASTAVLLFIFMARSAAANVVLEWNEVAVDTALSSAAETGFVAIRNLAIVNLAVHDSVNAAEPRYKTYLHITTRSTRTSEPLVDAAAASAAYHSLSSLFPRRQSQFKALLDKHLGNPPYAEDVKQGFELGAKVAALEIEGRLGDGSDQRGELFASGPGTWKPTPPNFQRATAPAFGETRPFFVRAALQFDPGPPPAYGRERFLADLQEVARLGGKVAPDRSADQTTAALFWTVPCEIFFNDLARHLARTNRWSTHTSARALALLNGTLVDASISAWAVKYKYKTERPITSLATRDWKELAPAGTAEWEALIITPPHPDYISAHSILASSAQEVLKHIIQSDDIPPFTFKHALNGIERSFRSLQAISEEVNNARVWSGVHTRTAVVSGATQGREVGQYATRNWLGPLLQ